jgi:hypothetical protein
MVIAKNFFIKRQAAAVYRAVRALAIVPVPQPPVARSKEPYA